MIWHHFGYNIEDFDPSKTNIILIYLLKLELEAIHRSKKLSNINYNWFQLMVILYYSSMFI
jgi:hypothetical protein